MHQNVKNNRENYFHFIFRHILLFLYGIFFIICGEDDSRNNKSTGLKAGLHDCYVIMCGWPSTIIFRGVARIFRGVGGEGKVIHSNLLTKMIQLPFEDKLILIGEVVEYVNKVVLRASWVTGHG